MLVQKYLKYSHVYILIKLWQFDYVTMSILRNISWNFANGFLSKTQIIISCLELINQGNQFNLTDLFFKA